jgi:hypothetical protein
MVCQCQIRAGTAVLTSGTSARAALSIRGKIGNLQGVDKTMIDIILSHWATYLLLAWLALIIVANLWPRQKPGNSAKAVQISARRVERLSAVAPFEDQLEVAHRER